MHNFLVKSFELRLKRVLSTGKEKPLTVLVSEGGGRRRGRMTLVTPIRIRETEKEGEREGGSEGQRRIANSEIEKYC
jgi:hypothetical protein